MNKEFKNITPLPWGLEVRGAKKKREYSVIDIVALSTDSGARRYNPEIKLWDVVIHNKICDLIWIEDGLTRPVRQEVEANANFIVHCVNTYNDREALIGELVEALKTCKHEDTMTGDKFWFDFDKVEDALKAAKGAVGMSKCGLDECDLASGCVYDCQYKGSQKKDFRFCDYCDQEYEVSRTEERCVVCGGQFIDADRNSEL